MTIHRPAMRACVLVFSGHDPSGGAGIQADIEAIAAQGAHALPVITALTVQDHNRVLVVHPVATELLLEQARVVCAAVDVAAIKIGILGSAQNAQAIADFIQDLRMTEPDLPIILDTVLASGRGHALAVDDPVFAIQPLLAIATVITPNLPELDKLSATNDAFEMRVGRLMKNAGQHLLLKGGHGTGGTVSNRWFRLDDPQHVAEVKTWHWPRLRSEFHGSGCTLAAAIAGQLALGMSMENSLESAQIYTQKTLTNAFSIGPGQLIPQRYRVDEN